MPDRSVFDTIRLSDREIRSILADQNTDRSFDPSNSRRGSRRWSLAGRRVLITLIEDSGAQRHFASVARDLSATGLSFLHGGYLHSGTKCLVTLPTIEGDEPQTVPSAVVRCRHLEKHLHDVGVRFGQTINPRWFIDFGDDHVFTLERVDVAALEGRLLVIESSAMFQKLVANYFAGSSLELEFVIEGKAGLEKIDEYPDMVFVDSNLPDLEGLELVRQARARGYAGPIVLLTADTKPGLRKQALGAGANEMLIKPCPPGVLHQAAAEYLLAQRIDASTNGRLTSEADPEKVSPQLVDEYIEDLRRMAEQIAGELEGSGSIDTVRGLASEIKASASGFGFEPISIAADEALRTLEEASDLEAAGPMVQRLIATCRRAAPAGSTSQADEGGDEATPSESAAA